jgi:hypothetical protein
MRRVLFYRAEAPCCSTWDNAGTLYRINYLLWGLIPASISLSDQGMAGRRVSE